MVETVLYVRDRHCPSHTVDILDIGCCHAWRNTVTKHWLQKSGYVK
jgi:hypothetical protein